MSYRQSRLLVTALWTAGATIAAADSGHEQDNSGGRFFDLLGGTGWSGHVHADWESRYVTEGRDNLDGNGIFSTTVEAGWKDFTMAGWFGDSPDADYEETNLALAWSRATGDWSYYLSYAWKTFPKDGGHDHEPAAGISWAGLPGGIAANVDAWHSIDASGTFLEFSLAKEFKCSECFALECSVAVGYNEGYVSDGHHGWNHLGFKATGHWHLNKAWSLHATAAWCEAIHRDTFRHPGDAALGSFGHVGVGIEWTF